MIHYQQKIRQQIVLPAMQFINQEKSGGIVLGLAVVLALVLANSPLRFDYAHFLHHLSLQHHECAGDDFHLCRLVDG